MGLYGALVVRPPDITRTDTASLTNGNAVVTDTAAQAADVGSFVSGPGIPAGTTIIAVVAGASFTMSAAATADGSSVPVVLTKRPAYDSATPYNDEAVLVLSEVDPALNGAPATFDMRNYAPKYFLINGKPFPQTDVINSAANRKLLLRYVNAGARHHSMAVLGLRQSFIAKDASLLPTRNVAMVAETLAPGQTADAIATIPAVTTTSQFAVYDGSLMLHNNGVAGFGANPPQFGGMLTFVAASGTSSGDTVGPVTSNISLTSTSVSATVSDVATGNSNVTAAEFFVDTTGANGSGSPMAGAFGTPTVSVTGTFAALTGTHTVYVHGRDSANNWGPFQSKVLAIDATGPTVSALVLSPNPSNGTANVALSATANDTASGGSNIAAAEYSIQGGPASVPMIVTPANVKVASLTATISAATINTLSLGTHTVSVRSRDSAGNWAAHAATINLIVDKSGPNTSGVSAAPNPNNGTLGINSSTPAVRVTATVADRRTRRTSPRPKPSSTRSAPMAPAS